jgi:DNA-binding NarL/FixJ family response regulator
VRGDVPGDAGAAAVNSIAGAPPTADNPHRLAPVARRPHHPLTAREILILDWISHGQSTDYIARRLGLARVETIKEERSRILRRLHARNAPHAVALAYRYGILPVRES